MSRLERHLTPVPRPSADLWQRAAPQPGGAGNLPWPTTTFVDRPELPQVLGVLDNPSTRFVTLVGPHGSGKTRLALAAAEAVAGAFADGVWFVDLAEGDAQDIAGLIAAALSVRPAVTTAESLADAVGHWDALLLLDSVDAALAAGPTLVRLLAAARGLKILATSRASFGMAAEQLLPVPPLGALASVALFCERAKAIDPRWAVTSANAAAVTELCARLEGLPLAIELATAWLHVLPADALLAHFPSTLDLLSTGGPDRPARHRTMRAAIAWSERRLTTDERALVQRLSVCRDGATVEALEAWSELPPGRMLGLLASLVSKSLVEVRSEPDGSLRYGVLSSVREYEIEQALADGALWGLRRDHAAFYTRLAEQVVTELGYGSSAGGYLAQLDREMANMIAVLDWSRSDSHPAAAQLGRRLGAALAVVSSARAAGRWSRQLQRVDQPVHSSSSGWNGDDGDRLGVAALSGALGSWSGGASRARAGRPLRSISHGACAGSPGEAPLSRRELEVVRLIGQGCTNREIAGRLCLSARTVDNHVHRILAKVGAPSRTALAVWAYRLGLVPDLAGVQAEQGTAAATAIAG